MRFTRHTSIGKWVLRLGLIILALASLTGAGIAQTAYPHHAGLVIKFGDSSVYTKCVDLGDDGQATGYEALQTAGDLTVIADFSYGLGAAMCKINQQGCNFPVESCFCQCQLVNPNDTCQYWSYWHLASDHWQYSSTGSSAYTVSAGAVEGWAWGAGTTTDAVQPPLLTFDQICAPATATPTSTSTATPIQAVVIPSATWTPTATLSPQPVPSDSPPPRPTHTPLVRIATPAPAVGSTVTPRPTLPTNVVPQAMSTLTNETTLSHEASNAQATSTSQSTLPATLSPVPTATIFTVTQANLAVATHAAETPTTMPRAMNIIVVATVAPSHAQAERAASPLIWMIFGGVVVSLTIGLVMLRQAIRPPQ